MVSLAEDGMKVCLKQVPEEAGYVKHPEFADLVKRLKELSSSEWQEVAPGRPLVEGPDMPWFWARQDGKELYIFFAHPVAKEFKYPVKYGQADTEETLTKKISINFSGKTVPVELVFKPYQSLLLRVSGSGTVRFLDVPWDK